MALHLNSTE
jgi:mRNA-degrading endonuclease RelE of RelBE toxin-antitoxin system